MRKNQFISGVILFMGILLKGAPLYAQEIGLNIDFFGYADNREFRAPYTKDKTIFGTLLSPSFYFNIDKKNSIYGGMHYNQDFGKHPENKDRLNPIAYYNYKSEHIDFALGFMPRYPRLKDVPRVVLADTFMYDRPNIEGMYFEYKKKNIRQSVFIDWISKQSEHYREQFIVGINGHYQWGMLFLTNSGILFHNALTSIEDKSAHIQDNAVVTANIGLDFSKRTLLDSLTVDVGGVLGFDRVRSVYEMRKNAGFISNIYAGFKTFFLKNTVYLGQVQTLPNADSFYHRAKYNRLDLGWTPFKMQHLEGKLIATFHFSKGFIDNQQSFTLRYNFGKSFDKRN
ncbi:hypothetical protein ACL9RF_00640 [Sphingobacterium sp. Mn56C]|uniref:hypothetical protein n=1 Tax=Sphingobacterium sp. Mn56C TaxID=3395261 RepID=UPI003BE69635